MERSRVEGTRRARSEPSPDGERRRFVAYAIAAVVAALGTVALAVVLLRPDSAATGGTPEAVAKGPQTASLFFQEFHATLTLTPARAGENTVDLILSNHDGSGAPDVSDVTVATSPPAEGIEAGEYSAEPVAGSPGAYRVDVPLPAPGDWEFTITARPAGSEPATETAIVPIGAR